MMKTRRRRKRRKRRRKTRVTKTTSPRRKRRRRKRHPLTPRHKYSHHHHHHHHHQYKHKPLPSPFQSLPLPATATATSISTVLMTHQGITIPVATRSRTQGSWCERVRSVPRTVTPTPLTIIPMVQSKKISMTSMRSLLHYPTPAPVPTNPISPERERIHPKHEHIRGLFLCTGLVRFWLGLVRVLVELIAFDCI